MDRVSWNRTIAVICLAVIMLGSVPAVFAEDLTVTVRREFRSSEGESGRWSVLLRFNSSVFPSNLASALTVTAGATREEYEIRDVGSREKATAAAREFLLVGAKPSAEPITVHISIQKGLSDSSGRRLLAKDYTHQFVSIEKILVTGIGTFYRNQKEKGLSISLTGSVAVEDLYRHLKITPEISGMKITGESGWTYTVTGDFEFGRNYEVSMTGGRVNKGVSLLVAKSLSVKGPGIEPDISLRSQRSVVELRGRQLLPLSLANVSKVRCKIARIPPALTPETAEMLVTRTRNTRPEYDKVLGFLKEQNMAGVGTVFAGPVVDDAEAFLAPEAKDHVLGYSLPLSFRKNPDSGGLWLVSLTDPDSGTVTETLKIVQVTDLSLTYRVSEKSLLVWVTSLYTGSPVPGAEVMAYDAKGAKYFVGKTDKDGLLMIQGGKEYPGSDKGASGKQASPKKLSPTEITGIVAATDRDACQIELAKLRLIPQGITQTTEVKDQPDARTGLVFTERGVYRPGETVHFKFLSRAYHKDRIVAAKGQKVKVEVIGPRDDVNYSRELTLNAFGSCSDSMETKSYFPVGTYRVNVSGDAFTPQAAPQEQQEGEQAAEEGDDGEQPKPPAKPGTFSTTFMVQDFKKQRHYASISVKRQERQASGFVGVTRMEEFLLADIQGLYYTGGPVKHGKVRWKANLVPVVHTVKGLGGFFFGNEDEKTSFLESGESLLDAAGKLSVAIPLDTRLLTGVYGVEISATVLDVDGEPATEVTTYNPQPKYLVGISSHPKAVTKGFSAPLRVLVADEEGKRVRAGLIKATVMNKQWFYVQKRDDEGDINPLWEQGWVKTFALQQSMTDGEGTFPLSFNDGGDYLVEFTYEHEGKQYASRTMFTVGYRGFEDWETARGKRDVPTANQVLLSMTKKEYAVGDVAEVQFTLPRPVKKCLVTVERGDILEYRVVDYKPDGAGVQFTVKDGFLPNVYVGVIAAAGREGFPVYASQVDTDLPMVYYGWGTLGVKNRINKLALDIAPDREELKARPAEQQTLAFKVKDQQGKGVVAEMAICVVDEAILALTRFATPDLAPLGKFNLPLSVFAGDLRMDLISQDLFRMLGTRPITGGGMGMGDVSPSLRKDFRPVAYFNPSVVTDAQGTASVHFKLPDTTTAYRVYAVVCDKGDGFVSGQRKMVVSKEFFIEPSLPRFSVPGDTFKFPVSLNNKTKDSGNVKLTTETTGDLKVAMEQSSVVIEPWSATVLKGKADVTGGIRSGTIVFSGTMDGASGRFSDAIEAKLPVLSRYLPVNRVRIGDFGDKADIELKLPEALKRMDPSDFNPGDFKSYLTLSTASWSKLAPGLRYLLTYPYGCVEQTSSGIIPLAGIRKLVTAGLIPGVTIAQVDVYLKSGIDRLLSMQTQSGGFAYWPGQLEPSWWGTLYATFALRSARESGLDVPKGHLDKALKYMHTFLFEQSEDKYHGLQWTYQLALLNLADAEMLSKEEFERFFERYYSASDEAKALLLLTAKRIGYLPDNKLREMLTKLEAKYDPKRNSYYDSTYREHAVCLLAAVDIGGLQKKADEWAGSLLRSFKPQGYWTSTADTGWCLLALGKYYETREAKKASKVRVKVSVAGEPVQEVALGDEVSSIDLDFRKLLEKGSIHLQTEGKALVTYTLNLTYPDYETDPALLSHGFTLNKRIENLNGKDEICVGDVVRVTLEIGLEDPSQRYTSGRFEYLALEDPVPAGLVPINSELKTEGVKAEDKPNEGYRYDRMNFTPNYFEFRDDGVRVFKNLAWSGDYRYSYLARAVAEGNFWMRGSRLSLMYDPQYWAKTPGMRFIIQPAGR